MIMNIIIYYYYYYYYYYVLSSSKLSLLVSKIQHPTRDRENNKNDNPFQGRQRLAMDHAQDQ